MVGSFNLYKSRFQILSVLRSESLLIRLPISNASSPVSESVIEMLMKFLTGVGSSEGSSGLPGGEFSLDRVFIGADC